MNNLKREKGEDQILGNTNFKGWTREENRRVRREPRDQMSQEPKEEKVPRMMNCNELIVKKS